MDVINVFSILFFLSLNAFFVLLEFAIVSARRTKIEELAQNEKNIFAVYALDIINNINSYLASIQLGITAASIGLGWVAQPYVAWLINKIIPDMNVFSLKISSYSMSLILSFFIVTFFHVVVGEQVPKYIAIALPEKILLLFSFPLKIFYKTTYYPMLIINKTSEFFVNLFGFRRLKGDISHSEDEIKLILSKSEDLGRITLQRLMMFEHLFDFGRTTIREIMVPKDKIVCINKNVSFTEFLDIVKNHKLSRYPVVDDKNNFIGYVHLKDIVVNIDVSMCIKDFKITNYLRPINRVKDSELIEKVLRIIQETHQPILLVENEKNEIVGLVSVEDIVEDITGEIRDEFEKKSYIRLDEIFSVDGSVVDLRSDNRFSAISEIVNNLYSKNVIDVKDEILNRVIKRERELSTAIGHQIAVPHARIEGLKKPIMSVGISENGVIFPSPDSKPVKVIFLILTPFHDPSAQLNILSKISRLAMNVTLRRKLFEAKTPLKIKEILTVFEDSIPLE